LQSSERIGKTTSSPWWAEATPPPQSGHCFKLLYLARTHKQGCHMVYFQTKNCNFGKFWRSLKWKMMVYVCSLCPFGIYYVYLVYFMVIWCFVVILYIFPRFGILCQEKSWQPCTQAQINVK
jgi:hypothetical protein